jgi:enamine deaminase RidA (YjgF/YER057c/UK114 family)
MSAVNIHGDTVYLAGQIADNRDQDTAGQTADMLAKVERLLEEAGSSKSKMLSATIYLADMRDFEEMNKVWDAWVDPENTPGRATVEARLAHPEVRVEVTVIAAL